MPPELQTHKPRPKPAPYQQRPREKNPSQTDAPVTSAKSIKTKTCRENLTLNDWLTVFELAGAEEELLESVKDLKDCNRIFGTPLTLDELLAPREEIEIGEERYQFDDEAAIVTEVQHQMAVERGDIVEIESDDEDTQPRAAPIPRCEILEMCEKLERICMSESDANTALELPRLLRKFRGELRQQEQSSAKQTTLDGFWKS
ncbi:hypothetical protein J3R83DRAFT_9097 [Lanmaoa asiatica]|nr:hypothetical protein J3R83DRAFT_9097 [Lanmaoa asiatica]